MRMNTRVRASCCAPETAATHAAQGQARAVVSRRAGSTLCLPHWRDSFLPSRHLQPPRLRLHRLLRHTRHTLPEGQTQPCAVCLSPSRQYRQDYRGRRPSTRNQSTVATWRPLASSLAWRVCRAASLRPHIARHALSRCSNVPAFPHSHMTSVSAGVMRSYRLPKVNPMRRQAARQARCSRRPVPRSSA